MMKLMQIGSAPKTLLSPSPCSCTFAHCAWQGARHGSPRGELVRGTQPAGNYWLVWEGFCWLSSPAFRASCLQGEGRCLGGGWDPRPSGLKFMGASHISATCREPFLHHPPFPLQGCNKMFCTPGLSILLPCRTGTRKAFLAAIPIIFYPQSQNFQSSSNPKTNISHNIVLACDLVPALRNPVLEGNKVNSCCGKQAKKGGQIYNHGGWGHLKEIVMVDRY